MGQMWFLHIDIQINQLINGGIRPGGAPPHPTPTPLSHIEQHTQVNKTVNTERPNTCIFNLASQLALVRVRLITKNKTITIKRKILSESHELFFVSYAVKVFLHEYMRHELYIMQKRLNLWLQMSIQFV